jgi:predicted dehydrogenase
MTGTPAATEPLRVGLLGASRIALESLVAPAADGDIRLVAVAARNRGRAESFAAEHRIDRVPGSYEELLDDPDVEVVYNALPNSLHGPWNLAAIKAGKHVLSEKPFATNAAEAREVADAAAGSGLVVFDAFHYRYHPIFERFLAVITGGDLGTLRSLRVRLWTPPPPADDLRWSLPLGGGAMMDLGCYALHAICSVAAALGGRPDLVDVEMGERAGRPGVDQWARFGLALPGGARALGDVDMDHPGWEFSLYAEGDEGSVTVTNFVKVHTDDRLILERTGGDSQVEHLGSRSTYHYQVDALTAAVRHGTPFPTDAADGVINLEFIDECYLEAGLTPRPHRVGDS